MHFNSFSEKSLPNISFNKSQTLQVHTCKPCTYEQRQKIGTHQLDLGARDLNDISYTTFLFLPTNPCDWFSNLGARSLNIKESFISITLVPRLYKYCRCIESRQAEPGRGWKSLSVTIAYVSFFLSTPVSPSFAFSSRFPHIQGIPV